MDHKYLKEFLEDIRTGRVTDDEAMEILTKLPYKEMEFANIDNHRALRTGYPEAILSEGKTPEQVAEIIGYMKDSTRNVMATRASREVYEEVLKVDPEAVYFETARIILSNGNMHKNPGAGHIAVVTAGTADIPVAEEAAITAEIIGNHVDRIYDVGVAGIHRLFDKLERIQAADVVIVIAGMDGALASVIGGLCDVPVVAVPTSVGYGAGFEGLAALLTMLNSCSSGVGVVNIDNGFGAAYLASNILRKK
ncbi:MAG: nickel pincer cofactor biosynthesis protein LarB [Lentihominibacter sp.]|jgi:NCAIR mutase (PurE)-related protein